jgi:hypothetical protein
MADKVINIIPFIPTNYRRINEMDSSEQDNAMFWYFHGKLQDIVGYDKGVMTNCKTLGILKPFVYDTERQAISKLCYNGTLECKVEGIDKQCTAFLYTVQEHGNDFWIQRGLVCLNEDEEACKYAEKKMNTKSLIL